MLRMGSSVFTYLNSLKKSLNLYSTSAVSSKDGTTNSLVVGFLVKSAGFSEEEAISVASKVRNPLKCHGNVEIVVDFLKENGFDGNQIRKVIGLRPSVLHSKVDKTLKPKFRALQDFGFSDSNIGSLISRNPDILAQNVNSSIVPALGVLKSLLGSNEQVISFMLKSTTMLPLSPSACRNLPDNVVLLQRYGLSRERIKWLMRHCRFLFGEGEVNINSKFELLREHGWSESDISNMLNGHSFFLGLAENHLRAKLKYFMEDLGIGSHYLAMHSVMLGFSMERRILPRVAVRQTLMDQHLLEHPIDLCNWLKMVEPKFIQKYVLPYKEKLPQLYQNYSRAVSSSLSKT